MDNGLDHAPPCRFVCGTVEIDAFHRRVLVSGIPARLGGRAFDLLLTLVERRDRVVPKRELMDTVWPRLVVEEGNLLVHVVALRKLLGSQAITTIPGRGYRFALPVDEVVVLPVASAPLAPSHGARDFTPPRGNLPASPALIGRDLELDAVVALLHAHAVVTIVGAGGIGKTRMALGAAEQTAPPDGRWWVELASVTEGAQVALAIAAALGTSLSSGREPERMLAEALVGRHLLLVLDGCEHLADEVASLVTSLRESAPDVRFLLTSQELLKCRDEQVFRLNPLAVPGDVRLEEAMRFGAVALFVERAYAFDPRFRLGEENVGAVIELCRRLDGIPLAIELAAARVPLLGVHGLRSRLDQIFNVLSGGTRMKLRRHQTLRAALEWSHGLLSADEQTVFRRIGVFAGGFTLELAQSVVGDERLDRWLVLDLLGHLIDKSLVIADGKAEPRYSLLETTRAYALEQLAACGESDTILRRHAVAVLEMMRAVDRRCWNLSPADRRITLDELGNLRAALDWAAANSAEWELLHELLATCWLSWLHNGVIGEGTRRMLQLWPPRSDLSPQLEAGFCLALARLNEGCDRALNSEAARRAATRLRELRDDERLGDALLLLATIGSTLDLHEAEQALEEAKTLVPPASPPRRQAALAATEGELAMRRGRPERAVEAFRKQRDLYCQVRAALGEYLALGNIGNALLEAGELDAAIDTLQRSVDGLEKLGAPYGREHRLSRLILARALRGDDIDVPALARGVFDCLRQLDSTFAPLMAVALQRMRLEQCETAVRLAGYASRTLAGRTEHPCPFDLGLLQQIVETARARCPASTVEGWLRAGELLSEAEAVELAFGERPTASG